MADHGHDHDEDELSRRDTAVTGSGFQAWLADLRNGDPDYEGEFAPLYFILSSDRFPPKYDFAQYGELIEDLVPDAEDAAARQALLLAAEAEWRVDQRAKLAARTNLGLSPMTRRDMAPLPTGDVKCGFVGRAGKSCTKPVVPGAPRCEEHGGMLVSPEVRQSMLLVAYARLVEGTDTAVKTLIDVAEHGRNEIARVMASKEILDRAGLSPELRITVSQEESDNLKFERLLKAVEDTRDRLQGAAIEIGGREAGPEPELESGEGPMFPGAVAQVVSAAMVEVMPPREDHEEGAA